MGTIHEKEKGEKGKQRSESDSSFFPHTSAKRRKKGGVGA